MARNWQIACDCGTPVTVRASQAGMTLTCRHCGHELQVPALLALRRLPLASPSEFPPWVVSVHGPGYALLRNLTVLAGAVAVGTSFVGAPAVVSSAWFIFAVIVACWLGASAPRAVVTGVILLFAGGLLLALAVRWHQLGVTSADRNLTTDRTREVQKAVHELIQRHGGKLPKTGPNPPAKE